MKHLKKFSTVLLSSAFCCGLLFSLSVVKTEPLNVLASEEKHADTKAKEYYDNCSNAPDGNYIKPLSEGVDYSLYLNDNVVSDVIMNVAKGGAGYVTSIRNYHNESMNYYTYLRYNSKHNAVGQLGSELIFNASDGSILTRFDLYNGYQVSDAFQIQIFDQETQTYVVEASDQMFSGSNATFAYTFSKPTTSFKIVHYLHSTSSHNVVAWKETRIYYENSKTLTFNSNGGTAINKQIFAESSNDVTVEPVAPTKANAGSTRYSFAGWYTDEDCTDGNEFTFGQVLAADLTIYAKWNEEQISSYRMDFETNGGTPIDSQTALVGEPFIEPAAPVKASTDKYNFVFAGWYIDEELTEPYDFNTPASDDITIYAKYDENIVDLPLGTTNHNLVGVVGDQNVDKEYYWDNTAYTGSYHNADLDSYETFDKAQTSPRLRLQVTSLRGSSNGITYATTYRNNPVFRICRATFTSLKPGKVFTFVRIRMDAYSNSSSPVKLFTGTTSDNLVDTVAGPVSNGVKTTYLQAYFDVNDKITSFNFTIGEDNVYCQVKITDIQVIYADNPDYVEALNGYLDTITPYATINGNEEIIDDVLSVNSIALRFGASIPVSTWEGINNNDAWEITDYGVMLFRTTEERLSSVKSVEEYYLEDPSNVAIFRKGNGTAPSLEDDNYKFTVKVNITSEANYDMYFCASAFVVINDTDYYFIGEEMQETVRTLAVHNDGTNLSPEALAYLAGNN